MIMKTVFVCGIHGAGKGYLCNIVSEALAIPRYSASDLIREYNASLVSLNKAVANVGVNQNALVYQYRQLPNAPLILLDGHMCLIKDGAKIERIPLEVFKLLDICAIVYVSVSIKVVVKRMKKRDGIVHDPLLLQQLMDVERLYCTEVANNLIVPLIEVVSDDAGIEQMTNAIRQIVDLRQ